MARPLSPWPQLSLRLIPVWRRNLRVWRKLLLPSVLGNFGEPVLYLLLFGYGFGRLVGEIERMPYMDFLAAGIVCSSTMFSASFEALYSAFTRMFQQQTWSAMLHAPLNVDDIVAGEIAWAATKGVFSGAAMLIVASVSGLVAGPAAIAVIPVVVVTGVCFAAMAMVITAVSPSYDFFLYYFTLALTPMLLISGVFFPRATLPGFVDVFAQLLPLAHAVALVRPLMTGAIPSAIGVHVLVLVGYATVGLVVATRLLRTRLAD